MDTREYEGIKTKLAAVKEKYTKVQGALETLEESNIKEFGTTDLDALQKMVSGNNEAIVKLEAKIDTYYAELKGLTNWNLL
jgi:peptidoglycan hydrolase CwlO-like protein